MLGIISKLCIQVIGVQKYYQYFVTKTFLYRLCCNFQFARQNNHRNQKETNDNAMHVFKQKFRLLASELFYLKNVDLVQQPIIMHVIHLCQFNSNTNTIYCTALKEN